MKLIRFLIFLNLILISNAIFGQIVQKNIVWNGNLNCHSCSKGDSGYLYLENIPMAESFEYEAQIQILQKEKISDTTALSYLKHEKISDYFFSKIYNRILQKKPVLTVQFPVIIEDGGVYYRILQVEISYTKTKKPVQSSQNQSLRTRGSSVLASGSWYKFATNQSGVYKLDYNFLVNELKIPSSELKTNRLGIFGYGGGVLYEKNNTNFYNDLPENNISIKDQNNNGILEAGDYILFYAAGPYRWDLSANNKFRHTSKYYSETQSFFLTTTQGSALPIGTYQVSGSPVNTVPLYNEYAAVDIDSINPNMSGRVWFSDQLNSIRTTTEHSIPVGNVTAGQSVELLISYLNNISGGSYSVYANDVFVKSFNLSNSNYIQTDTANFTVNSNSLKIKIILNSSSSENFFLDYLEVNTKSALNYNGSQFNFRTLDNIGSSSPMTLLTHNTNQANIWNVSTIGKTMLVQQNNSSIVLSNQTLQEFVIFDDNSTFTPLGFGKIENQNLGGSPQANLVIFTSKSWKSVADKLAQFHKDEQGLVTNVVDIEQVYNEFSSGNKDVMAIRRYLYMLYQNTSGIQLQNALLFGNACIDYKGKLNLSTDFIPTYETLFSVDFLESFCNDDFYGLLDPNETNFNGTGVITLDIGVGRVPVTNIGEANDALGKIKAYKSKASYSDWRNGTTLVSDDYDNLQDASFYTGSENMAAKIKDNNYKTNVDKIYLDAFKQTQYSGGQRYEDAEKLLKDHISFGNLLLTYIGHGGYTNWAQERILSLSDLNVYKNLNNLPFITTATCGFAPFDKATKERSAGEHFLLQKDGGAIAMLTTCREVQINDQGPFMLNFINEFYNRKPDGNFKTFGEISKDTKNDNLNNSNSQKVVLLGDPALTLNMPKYNVSTTKIGVTGNDTFKALSKITISGEVRDLNNSLMSDFNGFCQVTIFDKITKGHLNYNDIKDPLIPHDTFELQNSRLFKGSASVTNGKFQITCVVPKDINYALGHGKISYYAADVTNTPYRDAAGIDTTIWVGGANLNASADNNPPIVRLFMNDEKFGFGGMTNTDPTLLAKLSDDNGINTTGAGIGHDITAILDGNIKIPIILNNYFQTDLSNYMLGSIKYPFYQLAEGRHNIKVKAWDVFNNPGEGYTEFVVASGAKIALNHLLNYPNPFTSNTWIQFEHNRPGEVLDVSVNIMTISGKIVKRIHQKLSTDGFRVDKQIAWDGLDDYGDKIGRGVYVYFVTIRDSKGENDAKYEKMVILQ